jgi:hypothetical protein
MYRGDGPTMTNLPNHSRYLLRRESANHAAHRMAHKNRISQIELAPDLNDIVGIPCQARILE